MKRWVKITLWLLCGIVVATAGLAVWQRENMIALFHYYSRTTEDIATTMDQNKQQTEEVLSQYSPFIARGFTAEEEKQILRGKLAPEEALARLEQERVAKEMEQGKTGSARTPEQKQVDDLIAKYVGQLYGVKAQFIGKLGQVEGQTRKEYAALSKQERKMLNKQEFAMKYVAYASALEAECDERVRTILSSLKTELQQLNADVSIVKTLDDSYRQEKSLKKAYYLGLLNQ